MKRLEQADVNQQVLSKSKEDIILFIIDEYGEQIKRLIFTYTKNYAQTDDLFQEFLIKVYQRIDQFNGKSGLKTWLYRIAINKCKDYLRSPIHRFFSLNEKATVVIHASDSAENLALERERSQKLVHAILDLPIKYREIFVLRYYQDFNSKQISEALGLSESTVRTRIMRGKEKLKAKIGGDYFEEY